MRCERPCRATTISTAPRHSNTSIEKRTDQRNHVEIRTQLAARKEAVQRFGTTGSAMDCGLDAARPRGKPSPMDHGLRPCRGRWLARLVPGCRGRQTFPLPSRALIDRASPHPPSSLITDARPRVLHGLSAAPNGPSAVSSPGTRPCSRKASSRWRWRAACRSFGYLTTDAQAGHTRAPGWRRKVRTSETALGVPPCLSS